MNIQIYCGKKNFDCQKAERWFKERGIKYQMIDLAKKTMSPREFEAVRAQVGVRAMVERHSKSFLESTLAYISGDDVLAGELFLNQHLLKTPVVRNGRFATVGFAPGAWEKWAKQD